MLDNYLNIDILSSNDYGNGWGFSVDGYDLTGNGDEKETTSHSGNQKNPGFLNKMCLAPWALEKFNLSH